MKPDDVLYWVKLTYKECSVDFLCLPILWINKTMSKHYLPFISVFCSFPPIWVFDFFLYHQFKKFLSDVTSNPQHLSCLKFLIIRTKVLSFMYIYQNLVIYSAKGSFQFKVLKCSVSFFFSSLSWSSSSLLYAILTILPPGFY